MNDTRKHTTKIVRMTSKQKYWYHASFKTGDLFLYLWGCLIMCSNHQVARSSGCCSWSTVIDPISFARVVNCGSFNINTIWLVDFTSILESPLEISAKFYSFSTKKQKWRVLKLVFVSPAWPLQIIVYKF